VLVGFPDLPGLFPAQFSALHLLWDASLAEVPDGAAKAGRIAVGETAARAMLVARTGDGQGGPFTVVEGRHPGEWRLGPPQGPTGIVPRDPAPWVGNVRSFLVPDAEFLRTDGPNPLTSDAYADDFNEINEVGSVTSTKRTADQTTAAILAGQRPGDLEPRLPGARDELDIVDSSASSP
jgi:hypothetical protein